MTHSTQDEFFSCAAMVLIISRYSRRIFKDGILINADQLSRLFTPYLHGLHNGFFFIKF